MVEMKAGPVFEISIPCSIQTPSAAQAAEAHGVFVSIDYDRGVGRGSAPAWRPFFRLCCAENVERGSGAVDWRHSPDPRCAAPGKGSVQVLYACLPERCPVPREGSRWAGCTSRRTGSTTASVAGSRSVSANAATTATCTAPGSAGRSGVESPSSGRRHGINAAAVERGGTPSGNAGGVSGNSKNTTK